jgi:hypothetical protein
LQVSLPETIQTPQMRVSMALALSASGAILSASKSVSRLGVRGPRSWRGQSLGGVTLSGDDGFASGALCANDGVTAGAAVKSSNTESTVGPVNRLAMAMSLAAEHGTTRPNSGQRPVNELNI